MKKTKLKIYKKNYFCRKLAIKNLKIIKKEIIKNKLYLILLALLFILLFWLINFEAAFFISIFLLFFIMQWENRIFLVLVMFFLITSSVLLTLKKEILTEKMAIYAYYFLIMTVILQIIEYKKDASQNKFSIKLKKWQKKIKTFFSF